MNDLKKFNKGEVYWYINPTKQKNNYCQFDEDQDFISDRPVLIVSDYIDHYGSMVTIAVMTTSSKRFGIEIKYMEGDELITSKILPYRLRTVPVKYLKKYNGRISDDIMEEVDKAINYHLGINKSQYIPKYVLDEKEFVTNQNQNIPEETKTHKYHKYHKPIIINKSPIDISATLAINKNESKISGLISDKYYKETKNYITPGVNVEKAIEKIVHPDKQTKKIYKTKFSSTRDKFISIILDSNEISLQRGISLVTASSIKELAKYEFAIYGERLKRNIKSHKKDLSKLSDKEKYLYLTFGKDELLSLIKKESSAMKYRSQFINDLNLKNYNV